MLPPFHTFSIRSFPTGLIFQNEADLDSSNNPGSSEGVTEERDARREESAERTNERAMKKEEREKDEPKDLVHHGGDHHLLDMSTEGVAGHDEAERAKEAARREGQDEVEEKRRSEETHTIAGTKFLFPFQAMNTPKAPPAHQRRPRAVCWRSAGREDRR